MSVRILVGDVRAQLRTLPDESVHCVVTSPPYWGLRDYKVSGQIGLEKTVDEYVAKMVEVFREVRGGVSALQHAVFPGGASGPGVVEGRSGDSGEV